MIPPDALLLTAGHGTRLRPLSDLVAKPALPVAGRPLVAHLLERLRGAGVERAILNLHHRPESITRIVGDGRAWGLDVRYSWEQPILGSAGGPRRAFALTDAPRLWLVNGDTLAAIDAAAMARAHESSGALVTMAVIPNPAPQRYGGVVVAEDGAIVRFAPRGPASAGTWHFVGTQIAERAAFAPVPEGQVSESVGAVYPTLMAAAAGSVRAYRTDTAFHDIGTPADYLATCLALAGDDEAALVGRKVRLAPTARLERTVVWDRAAIGDNVRLTGCIVASDVIVPAGTRLSGQVLLRRDDGGLATSPLAPA